jgi:uncharacterized LabA/DUF88 family protein
MDQPIPDRVCFLVDGFNLYHSICQAAKELNGVPVKWMDLPSLCQNHLYLMGMRARIVRIVYFTAYAHHLHENNPGKVSRHKAYTRALTANSVEVRESHFKRKDTFDLKTRTVFVTYEEKETDVAIASALFEGGVLNLFDTAVLVTGDTDLRPAVATFQRLYPHKRVLFAFPFARKNRELANLAPGSFSFSAESYAANQFLPQVRLPSGKFVHKPTEW